MPTPIESVTTSLAAFIGQTPGPSSPARVQNWREFGLIWPEETALATAVEEFFRNGGRTAWIAPVTTLTPRSAARAARGLNTDVAIVVIAADPAAPPDVIAAVTEALRGRAAVLLVEPGWPTVTAARAELEQGAARALGAAGSDVIAYWPRLVRKGVRGHEEISPLGPVAGLMARTDELIGVWRAPAGTSAGLRGIHSLAVPLADADLDFLTPAGINTIRAFAGRGTMVWGARTTSPDPEWRYVSVRRTALYLTESIRRGLEWVVFEPNDEALWTQVRSEVSTFLLAHFRAGAFIGAKPEEAFFVRCDRSTMTEADIASGTLIVLFGFAALQPAEFIVQTVRLRTGDGLPPIA